MPDLKISVKNKVALCDGSAIVCNNSDYRVVFEFDAEWADLNTKTMRVQNGGEYVDVVFTGNTATLPVQTELYGVQIGVYAGNIHTTTPAVFKCVPSATSAGGTVVAPQPSVYDQIMALMQTTMASASASADRAETAEDGAEAAQAAAYASAEDAEDFATEAAAIMGLATFAVDTATGELSITYPTPYSGATFAINQYGYLEVTTA